MIDGIWWLVILVTVVVGLWLLAKSRAPKAADKLSPQSSAKKPLNDALQKTSELVKQYFPDYRVNRKTNHLLISKQHKKLAMITIDKKLAVGQRRLGEVPVINYHRVPSLAQLTANLQDIE